MNIYLAINISNTPTHFIIKTKPQHARHQNVTTGKHSKRASPDNLGGNVTEWLRQCWTPDYEVPGSNLGHRPLMPAAYSPADEFRKKMWSKEK